MQDFDIIFYDKPDGTEPVKEFLDSLDVKMRAKMIRTIVMLQKNGYELRAKVGSDISRVLYFFIVGKKVVLTNGFIKKTQKTPKEELERAKQYRAEYLSRKERDLT